MRFKRLAIIPAAIAVCGFVSACSYHKTVESSTPSPVVESAPAPIVETAPPVVVQPAPAPMTSSSTTTTTTDNGSGLVERQKTTTYTPAY